MRFLLDNDVDAAVGRVLRRAGHECWTAAEAGLAGPRAADDDAVSVYAHSKRAAVVTHDADFSRRRKTNTFGWHVWIRCEQPDAADLVEHHLADLVTALEQQTDFVVELSPRHGVRVFPPSWT